jgi:hypothetical protein
MTIDQGIPVPPPATVTAWSLTPEQVANRYAHDKVTDLSGRCVEPLSELTARCVFQRMYAIALRAERARRHRITASHSVTERGVTA